MKEFLYKSSAGLQLLVIFFSTALIMVAYEFSKELIFGGSLTSWESHAITIAVTAAFATVASLFMRGWVTKINGQLNIAAVAFESQDGMVVTDAQKVILRVNRAFTRITGYTEDEVIGRTPKMLSSALHDDAFYAEMWESIQRRGEWQGEIYDRRKSGEVYPERLSITAVKDGTGYVAYYVGVLVDEEVLNLAFYDTLTRLPNRRLLSDRIDQAMIASKRSGRYGAVILLDLDNFKSLNDAKGHDAGDLLLAEVATRLRNSVRQMDTVARLGGDEFVVVLRDLAADKAESEKQARVIAEKIRVALAQPYVLTIHYLNDAKEIIEHHCSSSIGVALFASHDPGANDILKRADVAMYQAKVDGRNTVRIYGTC